MLFPLGASLYWIQLLSYWLIGYLDCKVSVILIRKESNISHSTGRCFPSYVGLDVYFIYLFLFTVVENISKCDSILEK